MTCCSARLSCAATVWLRGTAVRLIPGSKKFGPGRRSLTAFPVDVLSATSKVLRSWNLPSGIYDAAPDTVAAVLPHGAVSLPLHRRAVRTQGLHPSGG